MNGIASLPPVLTGLGIVAMIVVLSIALYAGYAVAERYFGDRVLETIHTK